MYTTATINSRDNLADMMDREYAATGKFPKGSASQWKALDQQVQKEEQEICTLF